MFKATVTSAYPELGAISYQFNSAGNPLGGRSIPFHAAFIGVEYLYWLSFYNQSTPCWWFHVPSFSTMRRTWLCLDFTYPSRIECSCSSLLTILIRPHDLQLARSMSSHQQIEIKSFSNISDVAASYLGSVEWEPLLLCSYDNVQKRCFKLWPAPNTLRGQPAMPKFYHSS